MSPPCGKPKRQRRRCRDPRQPDHGQPRCDTERAAQRPNRHGPKAGVTGAPPSIAPLLAYLEEKYATLYDL
jgi:hypothetical protein